ncbi:MAG: ABC transporter permease [Oscillospiraceae bacterium]|jgi:ribose transport system permease protein|nr:ABC transporter permease [Oscillospiraceae bacterium]
MNASINAGQPRTGSFSNLSVATKKAMLSGSVLALLYAVFAISNRQFLGRGNQINMLQQIVTYSIIGYGLTFCLICGGTDLSAGSSMALAGIMVVWMLRVGVPIWVAIPLALSMGILTGILNGFTIEILGVVPFIATLGTQWVYRGLANVLINGNPIYTRDIPSQAAQDAFYVLGGGRTSFWLPYSVIITFVYGGLLALVLSKSKVGRQIYACGSNPEAARLSGINTVGTRMFAYCVSGFSAALCGILVSSRLSSAQPTAGTGYELEAIAAAVLGGVSVNGGEGSILNAMIGALIMGVLRNGLNLFRVNSFWQQAIVGFILVGACAIEARRHRQSA